MRTKSKSVVNVAGAGALALLMVSPAFAAPQRGDDWRNDSNRGRTESRDSSRGSYGSSYRENQRVNATGRITSLSRENGAYRVQLDNSREYYRIPASSIRNRGNDLRVGVSIVLGGIFRGGRIDVDAVNWPDGGYRDGDYRNGGYRADSISGVVERVDYRSGVLLLRDGRRTIEVDMRDTARSSRMDFGDLRRGDRVTLAGQWTRGGLFAAERIDSVRTGRR